MSAALSLTAPVLISCVLICAAAKGVEIYPAMVAGAKKGLRVLADILPALIVLFPAIYLLRASGIPALLERGLAPALDALGIPRETALLMLLRPISGSGALGAAAEIIGRAGADSLVGRTAAVMIGSSETTLYVAAVYFGAAGVRSGSWVIPAALCADAACFVCSAWICRIFWGG